MKYLKQYGIQRSGTNYMRTVFELNMDCRILSNIGGSKHERITNVSNLKQIKTEIPRKEIFKIDRMLQEGKIPRVVIIKNPYSWIVSISKYLNVSITDSFISKQITRYVNLNNHWTKHCNEVIYYENLIKCPIAILDYFSEKYNIKKISQAIILPKGVMRRGGDIPAKQNISPTPYKPPKGYKEVLTDHQIKIIQEVELKHMTFLNIPLTTLTNFN